MAEQFDVVGATPPRINCPGRKVITVAYDHKFVELNVVAAALADDEDSVETLLQTMLAGERRALRRALRSVMDAIDSSTADT